MNRRDSVHTKPSANKGQKPPHWEDSRLTRQNSETSIHLSDIIFDNSDNTSTGSSITTRNHHNRSRLLQLSAPLWWQASVEWLQHVHTKTPKSTPPHNPIPAWQQETRRTPMTAEQEERLAILQKARKQRLLTKQQESPSFLSSSTTTVVQGCCFVLFLLFTLYPAFLIRQSRTVIACCSPLAHFLLNDWAVQLLWWHGLGRTTVGCAPRVQEQFRRKSRLWLASLSMSIVVMSVLFQKALWRAGADAIMRRQQESIMPTLVWQAARTARWLFLYTSVFLLWVVILFYAFLAAGKRPLVKAKQKGAHPSSNPPLSQ